MESRHIESPHEPLKEGNPVQRRPELWFNAIFDNSPYYMVIWNFDDNRILEINMAFRQARGISGEITSTMNMSMFNIKGEEDLSKFRESLIQKGVLQNVEATIEIPDGSQRYVTSSSVLVNVGGQRHVISMLEDTTEKKLAEEALLDSELKFRSMFELAPMPLLRLSQTGEIFEINKSFTDLTGYTLIDFPTMDDWWKNACPDADKRAAVMDLWKTRVMGPTTSGSFDYESNEMQITCKDGMVRTVAMFAKPIQDSILITFFDITDRKRNEEEREKLQGQLLQSQKMEAIGTLAGGVAHDFNNMLGAIMGYAELTMEEMAERDPLRKNLMQILDVAKRSAGLTRQLLAFARKQTIIPVHLDLNAAIENTLKMLHRIIGENIGLVWLPGKNGPCTVRMDPTQIDQILANLCVNARDAIRDVGRITIETGTASFDKEYCVDHPGFIIGNYVLLAVSDDGCGMDKETISHVFEPFFTTKGLGKGTGLGLATIYGIVRQNEGFITVYSEPGNGTIFRIYIPQHIVEGGGVDKNETMEPLHGHGETILLIEDDPTLLRISIEMLSRLGYHVMSTDKPAEALRMARESERTIHLFISDIIMPEMNGKELSEQILALRPAIKHLFMSGYTSNVIVNKGIIEEGYNFIQKPFSMHELAKKVREILDQK